MIPYEKTIGTNSLDIVPEKAFFDASKSYSHLKNKCITKSDYETGKYLWVNSKMRNLNNMNNLYNVQDVILLLGIVEKRFEQIYQKDYFNPRKCNSACTLSGCIQIDLSKVIIVLRTSSDHIEIFKKTLTEGFSCIDTSLGVGTEILVPNLTQRDFNK